MIRKVKRDPSGRPPQRASFAFLPQGKPDVVIYGWRELAHIVRGLKRTEPCTKGGAQSRPYEEPLDYLRVYVARKRRVCGGSASVISSNDFCVKPA